MRVVPDQTDHPDRDRGLVRIRKHENVKFTGSDVRAGGVHRLCVHVRRAWGIVDRLHRLHRDLNIGDPAASGPVNWTMSTQSPGLTSIRPHPAP